MGRSRERRGGWGRETLIDSLFQLHGELGRDQWEVGNSWPHKLGQSMQEGTVGVMRFADKHILDTRA